MNVVSSGITKTESAASDGVVAAGVYVEGRRVANISIDEASSWRSKPDQWSGSACTSRISRSRRRRLHCLGTPWRFDFLQGGS